MKWIKRFLITIVVIAIGTLIFGYWYAGRPVPSYEGEQSLPGLADRVVTTFDEYGIPHIQAKNRLDAFRALGYLMASERLFQMELLRRLGTGRMAEVLGRRGLKSDVFFHTSGIVLHAEKSADVFLREAPQELRDEVNAFLGGVNAFVETGTPPLEFELAGIEMTPYEVEDLYGMAAYLAYSFSIGVQTDFLANEMVRQHGSDWVAAMGILAEELKPINPTCTDSLPEVKLFSAFPEAFGVPELIGSNAWAVAGTKTASGKPMLCNDTHIGYSLPQVWYEAAIDCPDFEFYGNFLPGIPYALVGHSRSHGWGLTMFENDDIDFYRERFNEDGLIMYGDSAYAPLTREVTISVRDEQDTTYTVLESKHGPVINGALAFQDDFPPITMRWEYTQGENALIESYRQMSLANNLTEFESALRSIHAPGVNVMYADTAGNIAWWSCARIPEYPKGVMPKAIIDGSYPEHDISAYLDFSRNPHCINPESGFLASANELAALADSNYVFGYYLPPGRGNRIRKLLAEDDAWSTEKMKSLLLDARNDEDAKMAAFMYELLVAQDGWTAFEKECIALLEWSGDYTLDAAAPVLWQPFQVALFQKAMEDDMTPEQFERFCHTHWLKRLMQLSLTENEHPVWDIRTTTPTERLSDIAPGVFKSVCARLEAAYGNDVSSWSWREAHYWEPRHPFADLPVIGRIFRPGEFPIEGGNETINQSGIKLNPDIRTYAKHGAQMRIIIDFAAVDSSLSIAPCGQSGHLRSPYFFDQGPLYASGLFRPQHMKASKNGSQLIFLSN